MRKGIRNFCNDDCSTSILNQQNHDPPPPERNPTLEEMILQLELEEDIAKKENRRGVGLRGGGGGRRMSCVNNSDILRSARNALNQYPRFSLDGKDAMYRSSFRNNFGGGTEPGRKSVCCDYGIRERLFEDAFDSKSGRKSSCSLGGERESVVWCEPGLIAKLMGLEAMPAPVSSRRGRETLSCIVRRPDLRNEMERRRVAVDGGERMKRGRKGGYCVMKPVAASGGGVWPTRRFI